MDRLNAALATGLACALLAGCSRDMPMGRVSGRVTFEGNPVTEGQIVFQPEQGPAASGLLDAEGRYRLSTHAPGDGAVQGLHRVTIVPAEAGVQLQPGQPPAPPTAPKFNLPEKYLRPETSELTAEVAAGSNTFNFALP